MIALSDIIILTVSSAVLAVALTRSYTSGESHNYGPDKNTTNWIQSGTSSNATSSNRPSSGTQTPSQLGLPGSGAGTPEVTGQQAGSSGEINQAGIQPDNNTATVVTKPEPTPAPAPRAPKFSTYVVRSGDSLSKIASRFNTTVSELQSINNLNGTRILVGQRLLYPQR